MAALKGMHLLRRRPVWNVLVLGLVLSALITLKARKRSFRFVAICLIVVCWAGRVESQPARVTNLEFAVDGDILNNPICFKDSILAFVTGGVLHLYEVETGRGTNLGATSGPIGDGVALIDGKRLAFLDGGADCPFSTLKPERRRSSACLRLCPIVCLQSQLKCNWTRT